MSLVHTGRKTGNTHAAVAMALEYNPATHETVICAAWGPATNWLRNIQVHPARHVKIGRQLFTPEQTSSPKRKPFKWQSRSGGDIPGGCAWSRCIGLG